MRSSLTQELFYSKSSFFDSRFGCMFLSEIWSGDNVFFSWYTEVYIIYVKNKFIPLSIFLLLHQMKHDREFCIKSLTCESILHKFFKKGVYIIYF